MFKKILVFLLLLSTMLLPCGCKNGPYPITKTIITDYGETLTIEVRNSRNMHNEFLTYYIHGQNEKYVHVILRFSSPKDLPEDPFSLLEHIVKTEYVNLYKIQKFFFFSSENFLVAFSEDTMQSYFDGYIDYKCELLNYSHDEREAFESTFEKVLEAFIETKQISYMHYCAPILIEQENELFESLIVRWAIGDITEEELSLNATDGYDKNDMVDWAKQFVFAK